MRALITGAGGQLGQEILRAAPDSVTLLAYRREDLDITEAAAVTSTVAERKPEVVINAAAYTAVDRAEEEPEQAFAVNAAGAENLARAAVREGARFIQVSTDFVFDGHCGRPYRPEDEAKPLGVYGASKLEGERRVEKATGGRALVLRTSWLYSAFGGNFVKTILQAAAAGKELEVVTDQVGTPTWCRGLAAAIWRAAPLLRVSGIHHWTDGGVASWYDFALAILEEAVVLELLDAVPRVRPIASGNRPTRAQRPAFSVLNKEATRRALDLELVHWRQSLRRMLTELKEQENG